MTKNQKIFMGIDALVESEGLDRDIIVKGLEEALGASVKKYYGYEKVEVIINYETKRMTITGSKMVIEKIEDVEEYDPAVYFLMDEAFDISKNAKPGTELKVKLKLLPELMDRSTIQTAKQVFRQKLREAKYFKIVEEYGDKVGEVVTGVLEENRDPFMYFRLLGDSDTDAANTKYQIDATLGPKEQVNGEVFEPDTNTLLVITEIFAQSKKGPKIAVSRKSEKIVSYVMGQVIPEINNGMIAVKSVSREAGDRSKVAVELVDDSTDLDLIGTCVGARGSRINDVRSQLSGENIDLVEYFDDPVIYISNALAPALVTAVQILDEEGKVSRVIVPDEQLSLAIGGNGQNVRLASRLTGWKIDIKCETEALEAGIDYEDDII